MPTFRLMLRLTLGIAFGIRALWWQGMRIVERTDEFPAPFATGLTFGNGLVWLVASGCLLLGTGRLLLGKAGGLTFVAVGAGMHLAIPRMLGVFHGAADSLVVGSLGLLLIVTAGDVRSRSGSHAVGCA